MTRQYHYHAGEYDVVGIAQPEREWIPTIPHASGLWGDVTIGARFSTSTYHYPQYQYMVQQVILGERLEIFFANAVDLDQYLGEEIEPQLAWLAAQPTLPGAHKRTQALLHAAQAKLRAA